MTVHEAPVSQTVEWYTPAVVFERLHLLFDLDPAHPGLTGRPGLVSVPTKDWYSPDSTEDGLVAPWHGLVWLNPPYGPELPPFVDRMIEHANGVLLVPARTETRWFQRAAAAADIVAFARDRIHFVRHDGMQARSSFGSVFMGFGPLATEAVRQADFGWTPDILFRALAADGAGS